MVWSEIAQKEYDIPNYYQLSTWIPSPELVIVTTIIAIILTYLRYYVQAQAYSWAKVNGIQERNKFSESFWKTMFYTISWLWGLYEVWKCDWFPVTANCWKLYPNIPPMEPTLIAFYLFQFGFYWHTLYSHFTIEVERSDYWPLLFHHVVTILLIYVSYNLGFYRIGLLVLVIHDTNDVFLEIGKSYVYRKNDFMIKLTFATMMISWVITRLTIFPFMIIKSTMYETLEFIPWDIAVRLLYYEFNIALSFLLCLHIYWFGLMIRILIRLVTTKEIKDIREKEGEDSPFLKKKN